MEGQREAAAALAGGGGAGHGCSSGAWHAIPGPASTRHAPAAAGSAWPPCTAALSPSPTPGAPHRDLVAKGGHELLAHGAPRVHVKLLRSAGGGGVGAAGRRGEACTGQQGSGRPPPSTRRKRRPVLRPAPAPGNNSGGASAAAPALHRGPGHPPPPSPPPCPRPHLCEVRDAHVLLGLDHLPAVRQQRASDDLRGKRVQRSRVGMHCGGRQQRQAAAQPTAKAAAKHAARAYAAACRPARRTCSCVVLPAPLTPTSPTRSPFFTSQLMSRSTCWFLKVMAICGTGGAGAAAGGRQRAVSRAGWGSTGCRPRPSPSPAPHVLQLDAAANARGAGAPLARQVDRLRGRGRLFRRLFRGRRPRHDAAAIQLPAAARQRRVLLVPCLQLRL